LVVGDTDTCDGLYIDMSRRKVCYPPVQMISYLQWGEDGTGGGLLLDSIWSKGADILSPITGNKLSMGGSSVIVEVL
jgi:hypothetical protein